MSIAPEPHSREPGRARVLVAEDHRDSREALMALLEAFGYDVLGAADGYEAIERTRAERPDLIVMDIMMPGLDGLEAMRVLRADPDTRGIPIIAVTALDDAVYESRSAGADDFLSKPVDTAALLTKLQALLPTSR